MLPKGPHQLRRRFLCHRLLEIAVHHHESFQKRLHHLLLQFRLAAGKLHHDLFLIHRYKAVSVHYLTPTEDNEYQTQKMQSHGLFREVHSEIGQIIVATVNAERIAELLEPDRVALKKLIDKTGPPSG